ncbi:MAG: sodium:alanine symporter family protein [Candidatus Hydrogenedentes bacterium]|nr:sodium:alanine symporter family protein [Candidatus Hydrogenedentota bacterium]
MDIQIFIEDTLNTISNWIWGYPLILLLLGTHIYLTIRLGFIQRKLPLAIRLSFAKERELPGEVSHFGALSTALAATVGTGNILGVATAISLGGPGAVFWMWITGVFGFATKYAEAVLSIKFRVQNEKGEYVGGPMYVLEKGLGLKILGIAFAIFTIIASFGIGNMVQSNAISNMIYENTGAKPILIGIILTFLTGMVIIGGIKSISKFCTLLVPFMVIFYLLGCLFLLALNASNIPHSIYLILTTAFTGQSAIGGFVGATISNAIRYGVARGLFSNEAGLGSAPIVASAAKTAHPAHQGLVSATGTFWDTVVVCFITGLTLVATNSWTETSSSVEMVKLAWEKIGNLGKFIMITSLATFVYSTILGWAYYGEKAWEYLLTSKTISIYRILWLVGVFIGAQVKLNIVWTFADISNALMALPNLLTLLLLTPLIIKETKIFSKSIDKKNSNS